MWWHQEHQQHVLGLKPVPGVIVIDTILMVSVMVRVNDKRLHSKFIFVRTLKHLEVCFFSSVCLQEFRQHNNPKL